MQVAGQQPALSAGQIVRRFWRWVRPHRLGIAVVLAASLAVPGLEVATIWAFKLGVDHVLVAHELAFFPRVVAAYAGITLLGALLGLGNEYLATRISEQFLLSVRTDLLRHAHTLPLENLSRRRLGDLLSTLSSDVATLEDYLFSGLFRTVVQGVRMPLFVAMLVAINWKLAVLSLVVAPALWLLSYGFSTRRRELSRLRRTHAGAAGSIAEESLSNASLVRAFGAEQDQAARFAHEVDAGRRARLSGAAVRALSAPISDGVETAGVLLVIWFGEKELAAGTLSLGTLIAFLTYLTRVYSPLRGLTSFANTSAAAAAGTERLFELLETAPEAASRCGGLVLAQPRGSLSFEDLGFRYAGASSPTLRGASVRMDPGEIVAIVGPSGAGKSTLLKLLLRFDEPQVGRILLDGRDVRELDVRSLRSTVAVVLQEPQLFHGSVRDNIAFGRPDAEEAAIVRAARLADAHAFISAMPDGYQTIVGQRGSRLSGGQRQRIALARALLREAPVLVLDEPTNGLDAATTERILASLREFARERTVIVLSHDARAVALATRVVVLEEGRLVERGGAADGVAGESTLRRVP